MSTLPDTDPEDFCEPCLVAVDGPDDLDSAAETFFRSRRILFGIAYRMLGNVSDTEDVLQETWVRWQTCNRAAVRNPASFLATTTTRLCLNILQSAHTRRETYLGPWLPDPVDTAADPTVGAERTESVSYAVAVLLESLTPTERAAYVLREAFEYPYAQIADAIGTTEPNARQLANRARRHIATPRRQSATSADQKRLLEAIVVAARGGNMSALERVLVDDVAGHRGKGP